MIWGLTLLCYLGRTQMYNKHTLQGAPLFACLPCKYHAWLDKHASLFRQINNSDEKKVLQHCFLIFVPIVLKFFGPLLLLQPRDIIWLEHYATWEQYYWNNISSDIRRRNLIRRQAQNIFFCK